MRQFLQNVRFVSGVFYGFFIAFLAFAGCCFVIFDAICLFLCDLFRYLLDGDAPLIEAS